MATDSRELTPKEIEKLPRRFRVALASRAALRVMPVLGRQGNFDDWGQDAPQHVRAVVAVVAAIDSAMLASQGQEFSFAAAYTARQSPPPIQAADWVRRSSTMPAG